MAVFPTPKCQRCGKPADFYYHPVEGYPIPENFLPVPDILFLCEEHATKWTYISTCEETSAKISEEEDLKIDNIVFHEVTYGWQGRL